MAGEKFFLGWFVGWNEYLLQFAGVSLQLLIVAFHFGIERIFRQILSYPFRIRNDVRIFFLSNFKNSYLFFPKKFQVFMKSVGAEGFKKSFIVFWLLEMVFLLLFLLVCQFLLNLFSIFINKRKSMFFPFHLKQLLFWWIFFFTKLL